MMITIRQFRCVILPLLLATMAGCIPQSPDVSIGGRVALETVADGLTSPVGLSSPPDGTGRLFVIDLIGVVRIIDGEPLPENPFLDVRDRMVELTPTYDERGLLGLAFHPQFESNERFFVIYSAPKDEDVPDDFDSELHLSEFAVSDDAGVADAESERIILRIPKPQFNHNGGQLAFGPDGFLYISVGDGGGGNDTGVGHTPNLGNGQDKSTLLGKILRIDVDNGAPYAVPDDNPFVDEEGSAPEIWALGFRNPWRFSFDDETGRIFVADAGQDLTEEVHLVERAGNYGWNIREGSHCFDPNDAGDPPSECPTVGADGETLVDPIIQYDHTDEFSRPLGTAVIGGFIYRGSMLEDFHGAYIFGDYSSSLAVADGRIFIATETDLGTWSRRELSIAPDGPLGRLVLGFGEDQDGELYVLTTMNLGPVGETGMVQRIVSE